MAGTPKKIFISYRRSDSQWPADRLKEVIAGYVADPARDIFMDVDNIPLGVNFMQYVDERVKQCDIVLALIGTGWLNATDPATGKRRLDDPNDFVRTELGLALKRGIPVVPVLLDGAGVPAAHELPDDLKELAARNGTEVRRVSFDADAARLIRGLGLEMKATPAGKIAAKAADEAPAKKGNLLVPILAVGALAAAGVGAFVFLNSQPPALSVDEPAGEPGTPEAPTATAEPTEEQAYSAFFNSAYSYCDAKTLAAHWGTNLGDGKMAIGRKILTGRAEVADESIQAAFQAISATTNPVCTFDESGFSYQDAEKLAAFWNMDVSKAKAEVEAKIQLNGLVGERIMQDILSGKMAQ
jgi:hypothetical protein